MKADRIFCMSSYLMYRYIYDNSFCFSSGIPCEQVSLDFKRRPVKDANSLYEAMKNTVDEACKDGKAALALSGGMDSAILARLVPKGTKAYTFRCVVPGKEVIDESEHAKKWAQMNQLVHEVIDIGWDDLVVAADSCMKRKGAPIHSIEGQIYLAAKKIKAEGITKFILGENADIIYGGMNGLLEKDWLYSEFVDRYVYVMPYKVLREFSMPLGPFQQFEKDGHIDGHEFINIYFRQEALGTYINACMTAGVEFVGPYSLTYLDDKIDYQRIRSGDTKYIIRELFRKIYPGEELPRKIPMPRPLDEWLADWKGPIRSEFIPHCTESLSGDQKWMVWCLERYLNMLEEERRNV